MNLNSKFHIIAVCPEFFILLYAACPIWKWNSTFMTIDQNSVCKLELLPHHYNPGVERGLWDKYVKP